MTLWISFIFVWWRNVSLIYQSLQNHTRSHFLSHLFHTCMCESDMTSVIKVCKSVSLRVMLLSHIQSVITIIFTWDQIIRNVQKQIAFLEELSVFCGTETSTCIIIIPQMPLFIHADRIYLSQPTCLSLKYSHLVVKVQSKVLVLKYSLKYSH